MISSFATTELETQQQRFLERFDTVHPYEESGRYYGCVCGHGRDNSIHSGVAKLDAEVRLPNYWERA